MDTVGDRIRELRRQRGMSQTGLRKCVGFRDNSVISRIENSNRKATMEEIASVAQALGTTTDYLLGVTDDPQRKGVPLLGTIACGSPILAEENIEDHVAVPSGISADFALRCKGNSMVGAHIVDGSVVFIQTEVDYKNGDIVAALIENEATLKRYHRVSDKEIELLAENPAYPPIVLRGQYLETVRILGKAVAFTNYL